jgi:rod shape determining protein RodA
MSQTISRREAALRTVAVACLAGLAVVQVAGVPYALGQGAHIAGLSLVVTAAALHLARALATAGPGAGRAAWRAVAALGALVAGGIVGMLLFEVFVNVGMNIGIAPITGIPLPLFSYGGSSVLSTFLAIGLLHAIHAQARETAAGKGRAAVFG